MTMIELEFPGDGDPGIQGMDLALENVYWG